MIARGQCDVMRDKAMGRLLDMMEPAAGDLDAGSRSYALRPA